MSFVNIKTTFLSFGLFLTILSFVVIITSHLSHISTPSFGKTSEGGVADADATMAIMMFRGEIEPFDPVAAAKRLEKAINNGSDRGIAFQLRNLLYGRYGYEQNIDLVKQTLDQLLSQGEDPYWCALMGDFLMAEGKIVESQQWYEKAVAGGENSAYGDLALARGINDDYSFRRLVNERCSLQ